MKAEQLQPWNSVLTVGDKIEIGLLDPLRDSHIHVPITWLTFGVNMLFNL